MTSAAELQQKLDQIEFFYRQASAKALPHGGLMWLADGFDVGSDWAELVEQRPTLNAAAVVLGPASTRLAIDPNRWQPLESPEAQAILLAAEQVDVPAWLAARPERQMDESSTVAGLLERLGLDEASKPSQDVPDDLMGLFPTALGQGEDAFNTRIILLPEVAQTDVHAALPVEPFNDYPAPHEHVAVLRYLKRTYDVDLLGMTEEIVELAHPWPLAPEVAGKLAYDLFCYCPDLILQRFGSFAALSAHLQELPAVTLWWD